MISFYCFSKDRPMQMEAYIKSLTWSLEIGLEDLHVLYCASEAKYTKAYDSLINKYPEVHWHHEVDFRQQVREWLLKAPELVSFGCDDVIYKAKIDTEAIEKSFANPDLMAFSLRLGKDINFSVQYQASILRPLFQEKDGLLNWTWRNEHGDWNYPFDLSASVYRRENIMQIIDAIDNFGPDKITFKTKDWGHPNRFEALADKVVNQMTNLPPSVKCFETSKASVITINRVQDVCESDVFDNHSEMSSSQLLDLWNQGINIDYEEYRNKTFRCIHTGACYMIDNNGVKSEPENYNFMTMVAETFALKVLAQSKEFFASPKFLSYMENFAQYISQVDDSWDLPLNLQPSAATNKEDFSEIQTDTFHSWLKINCHTIEWDLTPGVQKVNEMFQNKIAIQSGSGNFASFFTIETLGLTGDKIHPEWSSYKLHSLVQKIKTQKFLLLGMRCAPSACLCYDCFRIFSRTEVLSSCSGLELQSELHFPQFGKEFSKLLDYEYSYSFFLFKKT